jgi:Ca2+-dependent lipid-binding protein
MWRQVELHVIQGRNLGQAQQPELMEGEPLDPSTMPVPVDLDISCEIHLNETLYGRTTAKKGVGNPDWHESFTFNDLSPFSNLDIKVWQGKKLLSPTILGTVCIPLTNFRRREAIDGWFPVLQPGAMSSDIRVGDLRLEIKIHE